MTRSTVSGYSLTAGLSVLNSLRGRYTQQKRALPLMVANGHAIAAHTADHRPCKSAGPSLGELLVAPIHTHAATAAADAYYPHIPRKRYSPRDPWNKRVPLLRRSFPVSRLRRLALYGSGSVQNKSPCIPRVVKDAARSENDRARPTQARPYASLFSPARESILAG